MTWALLPTATPRLQKRWKGSRKKEKIKRLSKGIFYKPEQSVFGELKPSDVEVINTYLFQNGKRIAYLTGTYLYNQMNLTTQVTQYMENCYVQQQDFCEPPKNKSQASKSLCTSY